MRLKKIHSLPESKHWVDRDAIMLHACFQILEDYIEKEDGLNHACKKTYKKIHNELRELNEWWQMRKKSIHGEELDNKEDTIMLARLIKHRTFLWT